MRLHVADKEKIDDLLEPSGVGESLFPPSDVALDKLLKEILRSANDLVRSLSGSILLSDSIMKKGNRGPGRLFFATCFGRRSAKLTGQWIAGDMGIVGETALKGKPYISKEVDSDSLFDGGIDKKIKFETKSIICAPIKLRGRIIGVIELINKKEGISYTRKELTLLEIFADYTSTLVQNSLDARMFADLSIHDNLTGLYNDRYFYERLTEQVKYAMKWKEDLGLIFFDLDNFKQVNDTHGHLAGSRVLQEIGEILCEIEPGNDVTMSRYGGDEFVLITPGQSEEEILLLAEKIRSGIEKNVFLKEKGPLDKKPLKIKNLITASLGVSSIKANIKRSKKAENVVAELIKAADSAMYASKEEGKNMVTAAKRK